MLYSPRRSLKIKTVAEFRSQILFSSHMVSCFEEGCFEERKLIHYLFELVTENLSGPTKIIVLNISNILLLICGEWGSSGDILPSPGHYYYLFFCMLSRYESRKPQNQNHLN